MTSFRVPSWGSSYNEKACSRQVEGPHFEGRTLRARKKRRPRKEVKKAEKKIGRGNTPRAVRPISKGSYLEIFSQGEPQVMERKGNKQGNLCRGEESRLSRATGPGLQHQGAQEGNILLKLVKKKEKPVGGKVATRF